MTTWGTRRGYRCAVTGRADQEREQIARELHDVIAHSLSVMTVQAGAVRRLLLPEQEQERQALQAVEVTGREALTEMRRLVAMLRDDDAEPELAPQPSLDRLDSLIGTMRDRGLDVALEVEGEERELPPGIDLSAYRLLQEGLTNVLRSVGPSRAWVALRWSDHELELEIADEGRADGNPIAARRSIAGMRERAALIGGTLDTDRRDGGGFVIRARLPLDEAA
jgi:signal transduction histidine kinase